jgi:polyferredoxin
MTKDVFSRPFRGPNFLSDILALVSIGVFFVSFLLFLLEVFNSYFFPSTFQTEKPQKERNSLKPGQKPSLRVYQRHFWDQIELELQVYEAMSTGNFM